MGRIYNRSRKLPGIDMDVYLGAVEADGRVYMGTNGLTSAERCLGRVDSKGNVYKGFDTHISSETYVGRVDEKGNVYQGNNSFTSSEVFIGMVDAKGYVYKGDRPNSALDNPVGKADTDSSLYITGAAFLLLILPELLSERTGGGGISVPIRKKKKKDGGEDGFNGLGLLAAIVPILMFGVGVYLPYDFIFGNDSLGFAEYSQMFLIVYGLSAVMIFLSLIVQIKTGEPEFALGYMYGFAALILMVGGFREGHPFLAILSLIPALMLFAFPAVIYGLITFVTNLFIKWAKKRGRGPAASDEVASKWDSMFHIVGIVLLIVSGIIGYMIAEV